MQVLADTGVWFRFVRRLPLPKKIGTGSADRLIAATAQHHGIELWHTDTLLEKLTGFPHRYFKGKGL